MTREKKNCQIKVLFIYIFLNRRVWNTFHSPLCNRVEDHQAFTLKSWLGSINFPEPPTFPLGERQRNTATTIWIEGNIVRIKHIRVIHVWIWNVPHFCVLTWSLSGALVGEAVESLGFWAYLLEYDTRDRPGGLQPGPARYSLLPDLRRCEEDSLLSLLPLCLSFLPWWTDSLWNQEPRQPLPSLKSLLSNGFL